MTNAAPTVRQRLIEPIVLKGLANLELIARTAVEGVLIGLHRSPTFGFSQEFAEYRTYMPGDDLRYIDWNVFARADKMVIKRFFGDTNCQLMVLLDCSASMNPTDTRVSLGTGDVSKLDYARFFAAALVYLAARQHDAVGLLAFNEGIQAYHRPATQQARVRTLYHELDSLQSRGGTDWHQALVHVHLSSSSGGLHVVLSRRAEDVGDARALTAGDDAVLYVRRYKIDIARVEDAQVATNHHCQSALQDQPHLLVGMGMGRHF